MTCGQEADTERRKEMSQKCTAQVTSGQHETTFPRIFLTQCCCKAQNRAGKFFGGRLSVSGAFLLFVMTVKYIFFKKTG